MNVNNYKISWTYTQLDSKRMATTCSIENESKMPVLASCATSENDQFCKDTGRKLSMRRCLSKLNLNKEQRYEFWQAYRNMTPNSRW